jgi:hypothetical protein
LSCNVPITTSPGKLHLLYSSTTTPTFHSIGWNFIAGTNLTDITNLTIEAQRLADLMGPTLVTICSIVQFKITLPDGSTWYEAPLPTAVNGSHNAAGTMQNWHSTTLALVGHAQPNAPGDCAGESISRLHVYSAYNFPPGMKRFDATTDPDLLDFILNGLNASTYLPADRYGQQVNILPSCPVQWNAADQRRVGS